MERVGFINARRWDGTWVSICGPELPIDQQRAKFFSEFKPLQEHSEYNAILMYQTKGGGEHWHFIHRKSEAEPAKKKSK